MKKALIDYRGIVAQVESPENVFPVGEPSYWVDCQDDVIAYTWAYNGETFIPPEDTSLSNAIAVKLSQIESDRDAACVANVGAHGRTWQADKTSQELLGQAITLASAGLPLPAEWRDADNNNMAITTIGDLLVIAGAIAYQVQVSYATSWMRKAAVDAATTAEEVDAA